MAQAQPAWREATAVSAMTPLFWAKVVRGRQVARPEKMEDRPAGVGGCVDWGGAGRGQVSRVSLAAGRSSSKL